MDIKEISTRLKSKEKELDTLIKRKLPIIVGRMAKVHYQENFRQEGLCLWQFPQMAGCKKKSIRFQSSGIQIRYFIKQPEPSV